MKNKKYPDLGTNFSEDCFNNFKKYLLRFWNENKESSFNEFKRKIEKEKNDLIKRILFSREDLAIIINTRYQNKALVLPAIPTSRSYVTLELAKVYHISRKQKYSSEIYAVEKLNEMVVVPVNLNNLDSIVHYHFEKGKIDVVGRDLF